MSKPPFDGRIPFVEELERVSAEAARGARRSHNASLRHCRARRA